MKSGKIWGTTESIFSNQFLQVHRIVVKKGGFCSTHSHEFRWNMFLVVRGEIIITVHKREYSLTEETVLKAGDCMTVRPNDPHSFRAVSDAIAFEIYHPEPVRDSDIKRDNVGGMAGVLL